MLSLYSSNDIHFSDCSSLLHAIIQQTQIRILLYMNKDANYIFQGVKSFLGACRAISDILAAVEWVQPDISFLGEMFLNAAPSHSFFSRYRYTFIQF